MRFTRTAPLMAVVLVASVSGCGLTDESTAQKEDVVIAADLELSGSAAAVGTAYERALRLKADQINVSGVLGGRKIRLEVKDNRSDKTLSMSNITDFTNDSEVTGIITGVCGECAQAAAKTVNDKRIPLISLSPAGDVTDPITPYVFKVGANPADDAAAIVGELQRSQAVKVGLVTTDDDYGKGGLAAMQHDLDGGDQAKVAINRVIKPTDTDVTQPVTEIADAKPDALVVWAFADQAQRVAASARAAGFKGPIFFDAAAAGDLFLPGFTAAATNSTTMIFTQTMVIDDVIATTPTKAARKQWFRDYTSKYGTYHGPASFAADALDLFVNAMNKVGDADPVKMRTILETTQVDGLSGPIRITPANHSGLMPQALVALVANSGRWRLKV